MNFGSLSERWSTLTRRQQISIAVIGVLVLLGIAGAIQNGNSMFSLPHILALATIIFIAFPVHEFAHAAAAVALGDNTPRLQGRYTLNPLKHIDPMGAILIVVAGFGWAKPVQWNPRNITIDRKLGSIIVAIVGPLSNLLLAIIGAILIRFVDDRQVLSYLSDFVVINVSLFVFNLIPIPPLDGSHILFALLPGDTFALQMQLRQYGFLILFGVLFFARGIISAPINVILDLLRPLTG